MPAPCCLLHPRPRLAARLGGLMLARGLGVRTRSRAKDSGGGRAWPSSLPSSRSHENSNQLLLSPNLFPWFPPRLPIKSVTLLA